MTKSYEDSKPQKADGHVAKKSLKTIGGESSPIRSTAMSNWARAVEAGGAKKGMSRAEVAQFLGVALGYFNVLLAGGGARQRTIGRDLLVKSAELLSTSVFNMYLLSGIIQVDDLYYSTDFDTDLEIAYDRIASDASFSPYLLTHDEWRSLSLKSRYSFVLLYELATKNQVIEKIEVLAYEATDTKKG